MTLIETQVHQLARALEDTATPASLFGALVHLYKTPLAITPSTPLATYTAAEADYSGYAAGAITWELPTVDNANVVEVLGTLPVFRPTSSVITNGIYGLYITDSGGTNLLFAGQFDSVPIAMESTLDKILATIRYRPAQASLVAYID